jgi:hypothetical protein
LTKIDQKRPKWAKIKARCEPSAVAQTFGFEALTKIQKDDRPP